MSKTNHSKKVDSLALELLEKCEPICTEFEFAFQRGERPRISDYLTGHDDLERDWLMEQLLRIELEFRDSLGEPVTKAEYLANYDKDKHIVHTVFADRSRNEFAVHIRCPHCTNAIEVIDDVFIDDVTCPSCGSRFNLTEDRTVPHNASDQCKTIGHFDLLALVGTGAFGTVWKARDRELKRIVAIKLPRKSRLAPSEAEQFLREARAAAQLRHPSIVSVHEVGRDAGQLYIISDFVEGINVADWLVSNRPPPNETAKLCEQIANALDHAHEAGVIHRDLKPSNVMLDLDGQPHLMDFGLAKHEAAEMTMTMEGQVLGTPAYMSPEQARGEAHRVDRRTDVYSLGVMLFELLTGERPFRGNRQMLLHQILDEEPCPPRRFDDAIPRDLETICLKCLEKDPSRRYETAKELARELERFVRGEAIKSRPLGNAARIWRWCRRNPTVASLTIAVAVSLFVCTIVSILFTGRAIHESHRADLEAAAAKSNEQRADREALLATQARDRADREAERARQLGTQEQVSRQQAEKTLMQVQRLLYVNRIARADREWFENNVTRANSLLKECSPEYRHWEWHYLNRLFRAELQNLKTLLHERSVTSVAYASDGKRLASGSADGAVRIWNAETGQELNKLLAHDGRVNDVEFSPDGRWIASVGHNAQRRGEFFLWDSVTGQRSWTDRDSRNPIIGVAFDPNGQRIAMSTKTTVGGEITFWNLATRKPEFAFKSKKWPISNIVFSPDGSQLAAAIGHDRFDRYGQHDEVNDPEGDQDNLFVEVGENLEVIEMAVPNEDDWAIEVEHGEAIVWDIESRKVIHRLARGGSPVTDISYSPHGQRLVTSSTDKFAKVWDLTSGREIADYRGHSHPVASVAFSPDGQRVASANPVPVTFVDPRLDEIEYVEEQTPVKRPGSVKIWAAESGVDVLTLRGHTAPIHDIATSPDGRSIATASIDKTVKIWDTTKSADAREIPTGLSSVDSAAFSPDGRIVAVISRFPSPRERNDQSNEDPVFVDHLRIFEVSSGRLILGDAISDHNVDESREVDRSTPASVRVLSGGKRVVFSRGQHVSIRDIATGRDLVLMHDANVYAVACSEDGSRIASSSGQTGNGDNEPAWSTIKIWNADTGELLRAIRTKEQPHTCLSFSRDGAQLISASVIEGDEINLSLFRIWRLKSGDEQFSFRGPSEYVTDAAYSPNDKVIASTGLDRTCRLWDAASGKERSTLRGHYGWVLAADFSPDSKRIATASYDDYLKIWDVNTGEELLTLRGHLGGAAAVRFSLDGNYLYSLARDGVIRIWDGTPIPFSEPSGN